MPNLIDYTVNGYAVSIKDGAPVGEYAVTIPFAVNEYIEAELDGREPKSYNADDLPVTCFCNFEKMIHLVCDVERVALQMDEPDEPEK